MLKITQLKQLFLKMIRKILQTIQTNLVSHCKPTQQEKALNYELVECFLDDDTYRQGIKLTASEFSGIIVTVGPKVSFTEHGDQYKLSFTFTVEANPNNITYSADALHRAVGDVIVDLMYKDYVVEQGN